MKAIVFDAIGAPLDVLELRDIPMPAVKDGEVLLQMVSASISPGDFLFIANLYPEPKRPKFPQQIAGNHGAGIVRKAGAGADVAVGTLVTFSHYNSWAEYAAVPAERLITLPSDFPIEKAGQFSNLMTAWDLIGRSGVEPGQWLAVTAGNSTVSMMVMQFAVARGIKVIPVVRQTRSDLKALGAADVIDLSDPSKDVRQRVADITGGAGLNGIVDHVGGPVLGELIRSLAFGGKAVINGGMSNERFELHNYDILLKGVEIKFHIHRHFFRPPSVEDEPDFKRIIALAKPAAFKIPVAGLHPLEDFNAAIGMTIDHPERGKHLFKMS